MKIEVGDPGATDPGIFVWLDGVRCTDCGVVFADEGSGTVRQFKKDAQGYFIWGRDDMPVIEELRGAVYVELPDHLYHLRWGMHRPFQP